MQTHTHKKKKDEEVLINPTIPLHVCFFSLSQDTTVFPFRILPSVGLWGVDQSQVLRMLCFHECKRRVSKNKKGLGWWHWDAKGKPFFDSSYKNWFCPIIFQTLLTPEEELPGSQCYSPKCLANWLFPIIFPGMTVHECLVRSWTLAVAFGRAVRHCSVTLCSIWCAGGRNNIWGTVLWAQNQLCLPGFINWEVVNFWWSTKIMLIVLSYQVSNFLSSDK